MNITQEDDPTLEVMVTIENGLDSHIASKLGYFDEKSLWLVARNDNGEISGGLKAHTLLSWCFVSWLWIDEQYRGKGLGGDLLLRAEQIAAARNCVGIYLDTFTFQAPSFYKNRGYEEFGRIENMPLGHSRIWLRKMLSI